jgi:hypothetical protein
VIVPGQPERAAAVVSCHIERPLDDRAWAAFESLQQVRPGGFRIAALMRPPAEGESQDVWLARAHAAAARGPFGVHTHWTSPEHARPTGGDPAERVRQDVQWVRSRGLEPAFFSGGGWYTDERVRRAVAELGLVDCTATAFRPSYLEAGAEHLELAAPAVVDGVLVLPATHTSGMLVRRALRSLPSYVHVYFHDADLLERPRRLALTLGLRVLALRRKPTDLGALSGAYGR